MPPFYGSSSGFLSQSTPPSREFQYFHMPLTVVYDLEAKRGNCIASGVVRGA